MATMDPVNNCSGLSFLHLSMQGSDGADTPPNVWTDHTRVVLRTPSSHGFFF
jgi:hypothetical protein